MLDEKQIYRIDHYLGKETVQNILAFRFANGIFEPVWNRRYVDHVQVTVAEELGVELRGDYYDRAGALRDMVPNHIFQLITLMAMEPPISFDADSVHDEQTKILRAIQPLNPEQVLTQAVRGQYGEGMIDGKPVPAYRAEPNVPKDSQRRPSWRWLCTSTTGAGPACRSICAPENAWRRGSRKSWCVSGGRPSFCFVRRRWNSIPSNELVISIQPNEGISLSFEAKVPGPVVRLGAVDMNFEYADYFGTEPSTGYETLLYDCMMGDPTLFQRADMVEAGWSVVQPILDVWKALPPRDFPNYAAGSWGPEAAAELLRRDGREWRDPAAQTRRDVRQECG